MTILDAARSYIEATLPSTTSEMISRTDTDAHVVIRGDCAASAIIDDNDAVIRILNSIRCRYIFRGTIDGNDQAQIGIMLSGCSNVHVSNFAVHDCVVDSADLTAIGVATFGGDSIELSGFAISGIRGLETNDSYSRGVQIGQATGPTIGSHVHDFSTDDIDGDAVAVNAGSENAQCLIERAAIGSYQWRALKVFSPGVVFRDFEIDATNDADGREVFGIFAGDVTISNGTVTASRHLNGFAIQPDVVANGIVLDNIQMTLTGDCTLEIATLQYGMRVASNTSGNGRPAVSALSVIVTTDENYLRPLQVASTCTAFSADGLEMVASGAGEYSIAATDASVRNSSFTNGGPMKLLSAGGSIDDSTFDAVPLWLQADDCRITDSVFDGAEAANHLIDIQSSNNMLIGNALIDIGNVTTAPVIALIIRAGANDNALVNNDIEPLTYDGTRATGISDLGSGNSIT